MEILRLLKNMDTLLEGKSSKQKECVELEELTVMLSQLEVETHPVHRSWWHHRNWFVLGYWKCFHSSRSSLSLARLLIHRYRDLCYDAVSR